MSLRFFDAFTLLGKGIKPSRFDTATPTAALAMLDHFGIGKALVRTVEQEWSAEDGNRNIATFPQQSNRFVPVWILGSPQTGEFPAPKDLAQAMRSSGVKALFQSPAILQPIHTTAMGDLLAVCEEAAIPLLWPCPDYAAYERLDEVLRHSPRLMLVACNQNAWGLERYTFPLFGKYERFMLCLGPYRISGAIQETIRRFGADRLLFGSDYPHTDPGGATELLRRLDIDPGDKEKIASGNLERVLGEVRL